MISKTGRVIIAIAVQVAILVALFVVKYATQTGGAEVLLRAAPVDPRDPLRGDYLTIQLTEISQLDVSFFASKPVNGQTVYVPLRQAGTYAFAEPIVTTTKPQDSNTLFIKGTVVGGGEDVSRQPLDNLRPRLGQDFVSIQYGIEDYFIPEGSGRTLPEEALSALVVLNSNGDAVLKQLYSGNQPWP